MDSILKKLTRSEGHIIVLASSTLAALYYVKKAIKGTKPDDPPKGYDPIPVPDGAYYYLGHLPYIREHAAHSVKKWHEKYGPIINVKIGVQNWVFIGDPRMAHEIFVSQGIATSGRPYYTFGAKIMGNGGSGIAFNDYGKIWKNCRKAALSSLSPTAVKGFDDILWNESERCVNQLINDTIAQGEVNPDLYVRMSAINVMLKVIYAAPALESIDDPLFTRLFTIIDKTLFYMGPLEDIYSFLPPLAYVDTIYGYEREMRDFWNNLSFPTSEKLIKEARARNQDCLLTKVDAIKEDLELDEYNVNVLMSELVVAGSDPVSVAMIWTYVLLCHYPDVQKKLCNEIDGFIKTHGRLATFADRLELPYYNAFQKELMRFRPPNYFGIPHTTHKDVIYKNFFIPKGTVIASNTLATHFDKNFFDEPEKFMPERFMNETRTMYAAGKGNIDERDQFSFGWGRRMCPGTSVAENELFNNITKLMARCTIEPALSPSGEKIYPDMDSAIDKGASVRPVDCKLRFVQREDRVVL